MFIFYYANLTWGIKMLEREIKKTVNIKVNSTIIEGELTIPQNAKGVVLFAHGSGSSRFSPRNNYVAKILQKGALATLLVDLLTKDEDIDYESRFDINLLTERLIEITKWLKESKDTQNFKIGYFGASTGAAAAIKAAVNQKNNISAIVSRGGRVDLAYEKLTEITAPTLLIVGEDDEDVVELNQEAFKKMLCPKKLVIIPGASHLFEEPGALEAVARKTVDWFLENFD